MLSEKRILVAAVLIVAGVVMGCSTVQPPQQTAEIGRAASVVPNKVAEPREEQRREKASEERQARWEEYQARIAEQEEQGREAARKFNREAEARHRQANEEFEKRRAARMEAERVSEVKVTWEQMESNFGELPGEMREAIDRWSASRYSEGDKSFEIVKGKLKEDPRAEVLTLRGLEIRQWYKTVNEIERGR